MVKDKGNTNRQNNYDLLRAISCITVVILHIAASYVNSEFGDFVSDIDYEWAALYRVITNLAVPSFVMLSGAFLIKDGNDEYRMFYKKMVNRIVIPTIVFSVIYVSMRYMEIFLSLLIGTKRFSSEKINLLWPLKNWVKGVPHSTMWFMYMIIGLYIITPIIVMIKKSINKKSYAWFGIVLFIYSVIIYYTCELIWIAWFIQWMGYFVLGNVIYDCVNKFNDRNQAKILPYMMLFMAYMINILYWFFFTYGTGGITIPNSFSAPVIIGTLLQFTAFAMFGKKVTIGKSVKLLSKYSLEIYMLHPLILEVLMQILVRSIKMFPTASMIPIYAIGVVVLCCVIAKLGRQYLSN